MKYVLLQKAPFPSNILHKPEKHPHGVLGNAHNLEYDYSYPWGVFSLVFISSYSTRSLWLTTVAF